MIARVKPIAVWPLVEISKSEFELTPKSAQKRIECFRGMRLDLNPGHYRCQHGQIWVKVELASGKSLPEEIVHDWFSYQWLALEWLDLVYRTQTFLRLYDLQIKRYPAAC